MIAVPYRLRMNSSSTRLLCSCALYAQVYKGYYGIYSHDTEHAYAGYMHI